MPEILAGVCADRFLRRAWRTILSSAFLQGGSLRYAQATGAATAGTKARRRGGTWAE